jgi:CSLREA domain-containing protein
MKTKIARFAAVFFILVLAGALAPSWRVRAATYTVNTTEDTDEPCTASRCTLRGAITEANNRAGPDTIQFNILGAAPLTIRLNSPLPALTDDGTTIAGDTQMGYTNDLNYGYGLNARGTPRVFVDGSLMTAYWGLNVQSDHNVVRGLGWINFSQVFMTAVRVNGGDNIVEKNFFGMLPNGTPRNNDTGVELLGDGNSVLDNNIAVGDGVGIDIFGGSGDVVQGNLIGIDPTGVRAAQESSGIGVRAISSTTDLLIGGTLPGQRNIISGLAPEGEGINVHTGARIINNYIGLNLPGTAAIPNWTGIYAGCNGCEDYFERDHPELAPTLVQGNVISGNTYGVILDSDGTILKGNLIGTDPAGSAALGRQEYGIYNEKAWNLVIGGIEPGEGNLISGNGTGIFIAPKNMGAEIFGNKIGTNLAGTAAIPNEVGILLQSRFNYVGGDEGGSGNLISGNTIGVWVEGDSNFITNNRIGLAASGAAAIPNGEGIKAVDLRGLNISGQNDIARNSSYGIHLVHVTNARILHNTIRSNGGDGIFLDGEGHMDWSQNKFSENSIFLNGGLGIRFSEPGLNDGIETPAITRMSNTSADGTARPGVVYYLEFFLAEPDPSGFGEGKTYLTNGYSRSDGTFHVDFGRRLDNCDAVTATATDEYNSTSEFSNYLYAGTCFVIPSGTALVWVIGWGAGGSALMVVISVLLRPRRRFGVSPVLPGLLGGMIGAGVAVLMLALPVVHVEFPQDQPAPPSLSACGPFIEESLLLPEDGKTFDPGTDVLFELSPQPDPPGMQTRWFLEVVGPDQSTVRKGISSNSILLSELGFDPQQTGLYLWTLEGERSQGGSNIWTPLCRDIVRRMFYIDAPAVQYITTPSATPTAESSTTPTVTPTLSAPTATLLQNANCRRGPHPDSDSVATLTQGSNVPIVGRNPDSTWWQVQVPGSQTRCWVAGETAETSGDTSQVPIVEAGPPACWVYDPNQQKNVCTSPCPQGAKPGGACTP